MIFFFTGMKLKFNEFVDFIWPDENSNVADKTYKHRQMDTILIGLGGAFIALMIILYNFDKSKLLCDVLFLILWTHRKN